MRNFFTALCLVFSITNTCFGETVITNRRGYGRLGDQLMLVCKGYWASYRYQLPYVPMILDDLHQVNFPKKPLPVPRNTRDRQEISNSHWIHRKGSLYQLNLQSKFPKWESPFEVGSWKGLIDNDEFLGHFRALLEPFRPKVCAPVPTDCTSVAVHIRRGGGFDLPLYSKQLYTLPEKIPPAERHLVRFRGPPCIDLGEPLKFPPLQFYVDSIKNLSKILGDSRMYIHVFTDDLNPVELLSQLEHAVALPNIEWYIRGEGNGPKTNILYDLFSMTNFDCLIRGGSHFCQVAHLLGDYRVVIFPSTYFWYNDDTLVMDKIQTVRDGNYTFPRINSRREPCYRWPKPSVPVGQALLK